MAKRRADSADLSSDKNNSNKKSKGNTFAWTDSEIQLLLETTQEFKAKQEYEGVDWNSIRTRFDQIQVAFINSYPSTVDEEYPHVGDIKETFSKERILLKLKAIRLGYKKALDSGRVSGGGRVVACFYDICSKIWGGSPAVEKMPCGVETSAVNETPSGVQTEGVILEQTNEIASTSWDTDGNVNSATATSTVTANNVHNSSDSDIQANPSNCDSSVNRRQILTDKLKDYRSKKLQKKVSVESQLAAISKEDLELKKSLVDQLKTSDLEHSEHMKNLSNTMNQMTQCISSGFQLLSNIINQQPMTAMQTPTQPTQPSYLYQAHQKQPSTHEVDYAPQEQHNNCKQKE